MNHNFFICFPRGCVKKSAWNVSDHSSNFLATPKMCFYENLFLPVWVIWRLKSLLDIFSSLFSFWWNTALCFLRYLFLNFLGFVSAILGIASQFYLSNFMNEMKFFEESWNSMKLFLQFLTTSEDNFSILRKSCENVKFAGKIIYAFWKLEPSS